VVNNDAVTASSVLDDEAAVQRLLPHLPEGQRTPQHLRQTLASPQFRSALAHVNLNTLTLILALTRSLTLTLTLQSDQAGGPCYT